jgi:hypothetical protein
MIHVDPNSSDASGIERTSAMLAAPSARGARGRASVGTLLPVVYTLPAPIADRAYTNKAVVYDILFKASAEATLTIAADKRRLGASIGVTRYCIRRVRR